MLNPFLFFDVDGTLKEFGDSKVPESAVSAIKQAKDNGALIFIASGRPRFLLREDFGFEPDGYIFANGAGFEIGNKVILTRTFDDAFMQTFFTLCDTHKIGCLIQCFDKGYVNDRYMQNHLKNVGKSIYRTDHAKEFARLALNDIRLYRSEPVYKIDISIDDDSEADAFFEKIEGQVEIAHTISTTDGKKGAELNKKDVTKGTGALMVVTHFHGDMNNTWAFGDSLNDLEIIKTVKHGVAMANGHDTLKQFAEFVTERPREDGIRKALQHYRLI